VEVGVGGLSQDSGRGGFACILLSSLAVDHSFIIWICGRRFCGWICGRMFVDAFGKAME
jgi:polyferredoxin